MSVVRANAQADGTSKFRAAFDLLELRWLRWKYAELQRLAQWWASFRLPRRRSKRDAQRGWTTILLPRRRRSRPRKRAAAPQGTV